MHGGGLILRKIFVQVFGIFLSDTDKVLWKPYENSVSIYRISCGLFFEFSQRWYVQERLLPLLAAALNEVRGK